MHSGVAWNGCGLRMLPDKYSEKLLMSTNSELVTIFARVIRKRKRVMLLAACVILAPVLFYNQFAHPVYRATTKLAFEGFVNPFATSYHRVSHETIVRNWAQEITSLAFAEELTRSLPESSYAKFKAREHKPGRGEDFSAISERIRSSISVVEIPGSTVIQIRADAFDPELARGLADSAAAHLQRRVTVARQQGVVGLRAFLQAQVDRLQAQLDDIDRQIDAFCESHRIFSIDKVLQRRLRKLTNAEMLLNTLKEERIALAENFMALQRGISARNSVPAPSIMEIPDPGVQEQRSRLVEMQSPYMTLRLQGYDATHTRMAKLQRDIEEAERRLTRSALKAVVGDSSGVYANMEKELEESYKLQVELKAKSAQEDVVQRQIEKSELELASLPENEFALAGMLRQKEITNQSAEALRLQLEDAKNADAQKLVRVRVVDPASPPARPRKPRKALNIIIAAIFGIFVGLGVAFVREVEASGLRSAEEFERVSGWRVLVSVPPIDEGGRAGHFPRLKRHRMSPTERSLITGLDENTGVAETYRMLRTNLQFLGVASGCKTVMVTSIGIDEGKSTTLTNLAISLARMDVRVLLVDADLRRPQLHSIFGVQKAPGLSELLVYRETIQDDLSVSSNGNRFSNGNFRKQEMGRLVDQFSEFVMEGEAPEAPAALGPNLLWSACSEAVQQTSIENLKVLASGRALKNPGETLTSLPIKPLIDELKKQFDVVLIDSAPLLWVPETTVMAATVDGVLFVADTNRTSREMLYRAKSQLRRARANVIGAVLNNVESDMQCESLQPS